MKTHMLYKVLVAALACWLTAPSNELVACTVPVFRYALERWPADDYQVTIYHRGPLSKEDKTIVDWLKGRALDERLPANLTVRTVDVSSLQAADRAHSPKLPEDMPSIAVEYPAAGPKAGVIWSRRLSREAAQALVDSPARRKMAKGILAGDSVVWVLVESGNKEKDETARNVLEAQLRRLEPTLKLPQIVSYSGLPDTDAADRPRPGIPLRLSFSLVRVSRDDPAEKILLQMLLRSESDLHKYAGQPMAFPVFGRGRVLYALVGRGINKANVEEACVFLTSPCSCQVKEQNPGVDLLMSANWDDARTGFDYEEPELPLLSGVAPSGAPEDRQSNAVDMTDAGGGVAPAGKRREDAPDDTSAAIAGVAVSVIVVLACLLGLAVVGSGVVLWRRSRLGRT